MEDNIYEIIYMVRMGDPSALNILMDSFHETIACHVRRFCKDHPYEQFEQDDLIQEGMIGLFKAVQNYEPDQNSSFFSFAKLCISRQLYSAIEASRRKKHSPLNSYVSLYDMTEEKEPLINTMEAHKNSNPEELLVSQEYAELLESKLEESLSDLENRVLYLHLMGTDYRTIARLLDKSPKTVDNALQRIKAKTQKILEKEKL